MKYTLTEKHIRTQWPTRIIDSVSPNNPNDCFQLIDKPVMQGMQQQRYIVADAKYILCDNACKDKQEMNGKQLLFYFQSMFKTTFIPWVLARCTIIPL